MAPTILRTFKGSSMSANNKNNQSLIYQTEDGGFQIKVRLESETIWLTQRQMADLFGTSVDNIGLHLKNIYTEGELSEQGTTEDYSVVRLEGNRKVKRKLKHYNLDAIISTGYRVNSKQGTQFRIWANKVLKEYLLEGYALNESRLIQQNEQINKLKKTVLLFQKAQQKALGPSESSGLLLVLTQYTHSFALLNQYDTGNFPKGGLNTHVIESINSEDANQAINILKENLMAQNEATELFGRAKDDSFTGILGAVVQSFGGEYLYPSIEEQAAHLLYFFVKNHPFVDGNKRIGAFMFIWFLKCNEHHLKKNGDSKINDNALVAITLLVAQSDPGQKDIMIELIINLIKDENGL